MSVDFQIYDFEEHSHIVQIKQSSLNVCELYNTVAEFGKLTQFHQRPAPATRPTCWSFQARITYRCTYGTDSATEVQTINISQT